MVSVFGAGPLAAAFGTESLAPSMPPAAIPEGWSNPSVLPEPGTTAEPVRPAWPIVIGSQRESETVIYSAWRVDPDQPDGSEDTGGVDETGGTGGTTTGADETGTGTTGGTGGTTGAGDEGAGGGCPCAHGRPTGPLPWLASIVALGIVGRRRGGRDSPVRERP